MGNYKRRENLANQTFELLKVISFAYSHNKRAYWNCECFCGKKIITKAIYLKRGASVSCGCKRIKSFLGKKINDIEVIELSYTKESIIKQRNIKIIYWKCKCKCGHVRDITSKSLTAGFQTKCDYESKGITYCLSLEEKEMRRYELFISGNHKRRALLNNVEGEYSYQEFYDLCKKNEFLCLCCKIKFPFKQLHRDHINPLSKGGSNYIENIQPLCKHCNSVKHDKYIDYRL